MEHTKRLLRAFFDLSQSHRGKSLTSMLLLAAISGLLDCLPNLPFQRSGTSFLLSACESHRQQPAKLLSNLPMLTVALRNTVFSFSRPLSLWVQIWSNTAGLAFICNLWPDPVWQMLHDLNTYLHKAIPDTKLTIRKYLDVKFEYLVRWQHFRQLSFTVISFTVPKLLWRLSSVLCEHLVSFSHTA